MQLVSKLRKKYRSKRSDGPSLTTLDSDTSPATSATPTTASTLSNFPASETSTTTNTLASISLQELRRQIWNDAYDEAKKDEPEIFEQYEQILSVQLRKTSTRTSDAANETDAIKQDTLGRQLQMIKLVELGLEKTEKRAMVKGKIMEGMQPVLNIKEFIATAVKSEPTAAIAWVGVTTCMYIITNPVTEPGINRDGVKFVLERSRWHWELTQLLLDIRETDTSLIELQTQLRAHIARLYKKLLLYQIQSVVLYNRKLAGVLIRDVFKVDDWQQKIDAIQSVEEALRKDVEQHNSEELKGRLRDIDSTLKDLRLDIKAVETAVEQQTLILRKLHHDDKDKECLARLCVINPETHKAKIQRTGGGLLKDSYEWILDHEDFRRFHSNPQNRLLWIRGDPGKGKTMLLCGMIDELKAESSRPLSYAFCQATHSDFKSATSVLRSLIWLLCKNHPDLVSHVREKYDVEGELSLKDITTLQSVLGKMLGEPYLRDAILLVDALDECSTDRTELMDIISEFSGSFPAKWIVSSRNWPEINEQLQQAQKNILSLELNKESISQAVSMFVRHKVKELALRKRYSPKTREAVLEALLRKARDTFIWVALVCAELNRVQERHTMAQLESIPGDLTRLYDRMLEHAIESRDANSCRHILSVACATFRPLTLCELQVLVQELGVHSHDVLREIIEECGSFLTIQENTVYFIHQYAQDFLVQQGKNRLSLSSTRDLHHQLFVQSLGSLKEMKRNPYNWTPLGLLQATFDARALSDDNQVEAFVRKSFLHWLEALSILQKLPEAVKGIQTLVQIVANTENRSLKKIVDDMRRFIRLHIDAIEIAPLQVYNSALVFSPSGSTIREMFKLEEPDWIKLKPKMASNWDPCIQTLDVDKKYRQVEDMQFSSDGRLSVLTQSRSIVSWDVISSRRLHTINIAKEGDELRYEGRADKGEWLKGLLPLDPAKAQEYNGGQTVASPFQEPEEVLQWGWTPNVYFFPYAGGRAPDFGNLLSPAFEDPALPVDATQNTLWNLVHDREFKKANGQTGYPTMAHYTNVVNPKSGVFIFDSNFSPTYAKSVNNGKGDVPDLDTSSDIAYFQWRDGCLAGGDDPKNLKAVFHSHVIYNKTFQIVMEALRRAKYTQVPEWGQRVTFKMDTDEGLAILGSTHGSATAWMLSQHKEVLGVKDITEVVIWSSNGAFELTRNPNLAYLCLKFTVVSV
ncbi:hypothetical protein CGMCC3_g345 [Colletotrichum fructicola]|nr:uncharacterized protein CGMCC3_g345 [Colletotrichum fructicola]KAE9583666.1 hypothetical protein CGMCC3_g345 [Colletotrichum fructicola]